MLESDTCSFNDTFFDSERFLSIASHTLTSIQLPLHIFGVYIVVFHTPKTMTSAKWSILELHSCSAFMDLTITFLVIPYIWIPSPSGYPIGFLTFIGVPSVIQIYVLTTVLISVAISAVAFFENRYDKVVIGSIGRSETRDIKRFVFFLFDAMFCAFAMLYIALNFPDPEHARNSLRISQPCIPERLINNPNFFHMNPGNPIVPILSGSMATILFIQGAYFVFYTSYFLFFSSLSLSKHTQTLQRKFFIALVAQALIPIAVLAIPFYFYYVAYLNHYYNQEFNNFAMIGMGMNGLLTTIVMVVVHPPYRNFVRKFICGNYERKKKVSGVRMTSGVVMDPVVF